MACVWDARGQKVLFQFNQALLITKMLWQLCAIVKPHQKERSNAAFGNRNGVTEFF